MTQRIGLFLLVSLVGAAAGCGDSNADNAPLPPEVGSGGAGGSACIVCTGGAVSSGSGGINATGGLVGLGGIPSGLGGANGGFGGIAGNGGGIPGGGGGTASTGGTSSGVGGTANTGGTPSGGGGTPTTGGTGGGGTAGIGGAPSGGAGGSVTVGTCSRAAGSCTAPTVRVTDVGLGSAVTAYGNEGDTRPLPMAIAAIPSGGSRLAWLGTDGNVRVGLLDCEDKLVGTPFTFPAQDLQDLYADDNGGVVLLTRGATNGGTDNCGTGMLCGGTSSPCSAMYMVRFDNSGTVQWTTQVTNLSPTLAGYTNNARFIWWYQHHGRLAFDGSNYAAYHGVAITVNNGACVDIHEGDRMQVVSSTGDLLTGHDSFPVGCSHAWTSRIVWDPRTSHFVMVCATDNNCRIAQPSPYRTVASGACDGTLFGGDLVLSSTPGYWTAWSQGGTIRLEHFTTGASDQTISNAGDSRHPHLVSYGSSRMLLAWASGSSMAAQVRDAGTGATIGSEFTIGVNDHDYMAFKAYADGSVAYPASGADSMSAKIARVMPCN